MAKRFEPIIVAFCCKWCTYAGADGAGTARMQYPPNVYIIKVNCSGMVHPHLITKTLLNGADGVLLCGCHIGDCHYVEGNKRALDRAEVIRIFLDGMGVERERFRLEWVSAAEGARFCKIAEETTEQIRALGPSPYRQMTQAK